MVGMVDDRAMRFRQPVAPKPPTPVAGALRNPAMVDRSAPSDARLGAITRQLNPGRTMFTPRVPTPKFVETKQQNMFGQNQSMAVDSKIDSFRHQPMPAPPLRDVDSWQSLAAEYPYRKVDPVTRETSDASRYGVVGTDNWGRLVRGEGFRDDMDPRVQAIRNRYMSTNTFLAPYTPTEDELNAAIQQQRSKYGRSTLFD
jgi:hypothetical protein